MTDKDRIIVLMQENKSLRNDNAALTRELGELRAQYKKDVHGDAAPAPTTYPEGKE